MEDRNLLGAVGEKDAVLAFKAIGVRAVPAATSQETAMAVHTLLKQGVRVIFMTESAARSVPELIDRYAGDPNITIIPVPGTTGTDGYGSERLRQNVTKAIGADILLENDRKEG